MKKKKIIAAGIAGMAIVLCMGFHTYADEAYAIKSNGNILLEQENNTGKVAIYESDIKYLKNEIDKLKSQL